MIFTIFERKSFFFCNIYVYVATKIKKYFSKKIKSLNVASYAVWRGKIRDEFFLRRSYAVNCWTSRQGSLAMSRSKLRKNENDVTEMLNNGNLFLIPTAILKRNK